MGGSSYYHHNDMLPPPTSTDSYWRSEPHWTDSYRSTQNLPAECDILIIGTGIAGVSTAYHLLEDGSWPSGRMPSIVLLEARQACSGATARNGGHVRFGPSKIHKRIKSDGYEATVEITKFVMDTMHAIKRVIEKENIHCESEYRRTFDVLLDPGEAAAAKRFHKDLLQQRFPYVDELDFIGDEFAERVTSVKGARAAVSAPVLSLWPYKFVTQLLERVLATGHANLQTTTPVLSVLENSDGTSTATTLRGTIRARTVVFATNAYSAGLLPQYRGAIVPIKALAVHISAAPPPPPPPPHSSSGNNSRQEHKLQQAHHHAAQYPIVPQLSNTYDLGFGNGHNDYLNPRPDGGIIVGGGKWLYESSPEGWHNSVDDSTLIRPIIDRYFDGYMQRHFRGWEATGAKVDYIWTGIVTESPDSLPHIGRVPPLSSSSSSSSSSPSCHPAIRDDAAGSGGDTGCGRQEAKEGHNKPVQQYIVGGFNGGGMSLIFLSGRGIARMIRDGCAFDKSGIPAIFGTSAGRLHSLKMQFMRQDDDTDDADAGDHRHFDHDAEFNNTNSSGGGGKYSEAWRRKQRYYPHRECYY